MRVPVEEGRVPKFLLLFGMPRSGTTWIGKIFDSHPLTLYKHEPDRRMPGVPMAPALDEAERFQSRIRHFFIRLPAIHNAHVAGRLPVFSKQYRSRIAQHIHRASVLSSTAASSLNWSLPVWQCTRVNRPDVTLVWKSIDSLGRLGLLLRVMKDCRAIWITRHPCGSISSTLRGEAQRRFVAAVTTSEDFGIMRIFLDAAKRSRGLSVDHLRQLHPVERMAWIWVLMNEKAADDTQGVERCMSVRYEDVCRDPIDRVKELFSFSGLNWNPQTSSFIKTSTLGVQPAKFDQFTQDSRRYYSVFKDPIRTADKWKSEMKSEDIDRVYRVLRQSDLIRLYPESEVACVRTSA